MAASARRRPAIGDGIGFPCAQAPAEAALGGNRLFRPAGMPTGAREPRIAFRPALQRLGKPLRLVVADGLGGVRLPNRFRQLVRVGERPRAPSIAAAMVA